MSEIVMNLVKGKIDRIVTLVALATNRHQTARGDWKFVPQSDAALAAFEANVNNPDHALYGRFDLTDTMEAMYALQGVDMPEIRSAADFPLVDLDYGVALVPTAPVLGGLPYEYDPKTEGAYEIGKPVICISTWTKNENPNQRARGAYNANKPLKDLHFLPRRADLTRIATDAEIKAAVEALVEARGITFVDDVLKNLEDRYARFLS